MAGSTSDPKGVMVLHANLVANLAAAFKGQNVFPKDVLVSWLPQYHDVRHHAVAKKRILALAECRPSVYANSTRIYTKQNHRYTES